MISSITSSTANCELRVGELRIGELSLGGAPLRLRTDRRARRLRLRVDARGGGLMLTVPAGMSRRRALAWAAGHEEWAREAVGRRGEAIALVPGACVPLFGLPHVIDWSGERSRRVVREEGRLVCGGPAASLEGRVLRWLRGEALALLGAETRALAGRHEMKVERVSVGDPRSRWGSCSSGGAIRYSWRLIMAPDCVRRATVAHEVAHLVHMNHGADFHALVAELLKSDPAPARAWLRSHGAGLHRVGAAQ